MSHVCSTSNGHKISLRTTFYILLAFGNICTAVKTFDIVLKRAIFNAVR
jgi:hypothetical protein